MIDRKVSYKRIYLSRLPLEQAEAELRQFKIVWIKKHNTVAQRFNQTQKAAFLNYAQEEIETLYLPFLNKALTEDCGIDWSNKNLVQPNTTKTPILSSKMWRQRKQPSSENHSINPQNLPLDVNRIPQSLFTRDPQRPKTRATHRHNKNCSNRALIPLLQSLCISSLNWFDRAYLDGRNTQYCRIDVLRCTSPHQQYAIIQVLGSLALGIRRHQYSPQSLSSLG